jgi:hypothetical protein
VQKEQFTIRLDYADRLIYLCSPGAFMLTWLILGVEPIGYKGSMPRDMGLFNVLLILSILVFSIAAIKWRQQNSKAMLSNVFSVSPAQTWQRTGIWLSVWAVLASVVLGYLFDNMSDPAFGAPAGRSVHFLLVWCVTLCTVVLFGFVPVSVSLVVALAAFLLSGHKWFESSSAKHYVTLLTVFLGVGSATLAAAYGWLVANSGNTLKYRLDVALTICVILIVIYTVLGSRFLITSPNQVAFLYAWVIIPVVCFCVFQFASWLVTALPSELPQKLILWLILPLIAGLSAWICLKLSLYAAHYYEACDCVAQSKTLQDRWKSTSEFLTPMYLNLTTALVFAVTLLRNVLARSST